MATESIIIFISEKGLDEGILSWMIWNYFKLWNCMLLCWKWDGCTILTESNHRGTLFRFSKLGFELTRHSISVHEYVYLCMCAWVLDHSPICAFQITGCNLNPSADKQILTQYLSLYPPSLCLHFSFMFSHHYSAVIVTDWVHCSKVRAVSVKKYSKKRHVHTHSLI